MTNIAVGCTEDGRIAAHFPRSTHFQVFSVEDGDIRAVTTSRVAPALGTIGQHRHQGGDHDGHEGHHNHDGLLGALEGCSIVVSGGMGAGIAGTLTANGIEPIVVAGEYTPEDAVKAYLAGNLVTGAIHACCGHQHHA